MEIIFEKEYLSYMYENGKSINKKAFFQKEIISKYIQTIDKLRAADSIEDLYRVNSLNYEALKGDKKGLESVRVNKQYRIEFRTTLSNNNITTYTICSIVELSNHYK